MNLGSYFFYVHIHVRFSVRLLLEYKLRAPLYPVACGANMDLVLSKLEKDAFTVFTLFQNKYLKAGSRKSHFLNKV